MHTLLFLMKLKDRKVYATTADVFGDLELHTIDRFIEECYEKNQEAFKKVPLDLAVIEDMIKAASANPWFNLFRKRCTDDIGWIDFEKEIAFVIDVFDKLTKNIYNDTISSKDMNPDEEDALSYFSDILVKSEDFWSTYAFSSDCTYAAVPGTAARYISRETVAEKLYQSLNELNMVFKSYLNEFIEKPIELFPNDIVKADLNMFKHADLVLTYNYTKTYEYLYPSNATVLHVHGELPNNIVLGINADYRDELESVDTTFISFKKYYQRVKNDIDQMFLDSISKLNNANDNENSKIVVLGHSLDVTDKDTLIEVFEAASQIIIYYHNDIALGTYIANMIKMFGKTKFEELRRYGILYFDKLPPISTIEEVSP